MNHAASGTGCSAGTAADALGGVPTARLVDDDGRDHQDEQDETDDADQTAAR